LGKFEGAEESRWVPIIGESVNFFLDTRWNFPIKEGASANSFEP